MSRLLPLLFAAFVTVVVGVAVRSTAYFPGDVTVARTVQAISPGTAWATSYTQTAVRPMKWIVAAVALALCYALGGWRGALFFAIVLTIEQLGGEASKQLFQRPRPSRDLVAVVGSPSGYSFPSTFVTFHSVLLGCIWLLARGARPTSARTVALAAVPVLFVIAWAARVVPGAHWPSDVVLTSILCLLWLAALHRVVRGR